MLANWKWLRRAHMHARTSKQDNNNNTMNMSNNNEFNQWQRKSDFHLQDGCQNMCDERNSCKHAQATIRIVPFWWEEKKGLYYLLRKFNFFSWASTYASKLFISTASVSSRSSISVMAVNSSAAQSRIVTIDMIHVTNTIWIRRLLTLLNIIFSLSLSLGVVFFV